MYSGNQLINSCRAPRANLRMPILPIFQMTESPAHSDILILGATGYCGVLITRYLSSHPQRAQFTLALGGRSRQKLEQVVKDLDLSDDVRLVQVDVTNENDVEEAVKSARVVINVVGPYWSWGTPTVRCVWLLPEVMTSLALTLLLTAPVHAMASIMSTSTENRLGQKK